MRILEIQEEISWLDAALQRMGAWLLESGLKLLLAGMILLVGWWVSKWICKALGKIFSKSKADPGSAGFILSVIRVILMVIVVLTAIGQVVNISSIVAALGAAGLTASFALQGSLGNFVSGMQVIFSRPFSLGDFLMVGEASGSVKEINVLNTVLLTADNKEIVIPNSKMTTEIVINFSAQKIRRLDLTYRVAYSSDLTVAKGILQELVKGDERCLQEPAPIVAVGEHRESAIELLVRVWVSGEHYWDLYHDMQQRVKESFEENRVEIPLPQLDVHTK